MDSLPSSSVDNRIASENSNSQQSSDQTLDNVVSSSSDPKLDGLLTNASVDHHSTDSSSSNLVNSNSQPDDVLVQNECNAAAASSSQVTVNDSKEETALNIPLTNSSSHPDTSSNSVAPSISRDLPSDKCGMSNAGFHTNPGQCIATMGCNAAEPLNSAPVEVTSNHRDAKDVDMDVGINIKPDLNMDLSGEVSSPSSGEGENSPEAAVTISAVDGAFTSDKLSEESKHNTDVISNDGNMSPDIGETSDKIRLVLETLHFVLYSMLPPPPNKNKTKNLVLISPCRILFMFVRFL